MAAGCTLAEEDFDTFEQAFAQVAEEWIAPELLARTLATDGPLDAQWFVPQVVQVIEREVWGQAFEAPVFADEVEVVSQRLVGERHLKLTLRHQGNLRDGIWFGRVEPLPARTTLAYRLSLDEYNGAQRVQMVIEGMA